MLLANTMLYPKQFPVEGCTAADLNCLAVEIHY